MAASSMSMTSASRKRTEDSPATKRAARFPAFCGLVPNTAEYIFTPVGIPRIGTRSLTISSTSRAVPSPPANKSRSTEAYAMTSATFRVSSGRLAPGDDV
ncbi:hypothetical protein D3C85_1187430 [compost metagenome]